MTEISLSGRVALVTGSTTGIGRAIAQTFAAAGATVIRHGKPSAERPEPADAEDGGDPVIHADLADPAEVERLVAEVTARYGRLDILVNNAGVEIGADLARLDRAVLETSFQVNVFAPVQLLAGLLPLLRAAPRASVVNITSIHDQVPYPGNGAYCATKAALAMLTKVAAIELAPEDIRVNAIAPGAVETDINRPLLDQIGRDTFRRLIPLGRTGTVSEIAATALFLVSDLASYVTGATLVADGAYSHHLVRYHS